MKPRPTEVNTFLSAAFFQAMAVFFVFLIGFFLLYGISMVPQVHHHGRSTACNKKLGDIYKMVQMYANANLDEGGGDGLYPHVEGADSPISAFQLLVDGGFLKDPSQLYCPTRKVTWRRWERKNADWGQYGRPFNLRRYPHLVDYTWTKRPFSNEDEDPTIPLSADRWRGNHTDGFNVLLTTGKVEYYKRGKQDEKIEMYYKQVWDHRHRPCRPGLTYQLDQRQTWAQWKVKVAGVIALVLILWLVRQFWRHKREKV